MQIKIDSSALIYWYKNNKRPLPFRSTKDPYKIWISETMLQQTQVKTVIPYYMNWMKHYPDIETLQKADINKIYKLGSASIDLSKLKINLNLRPQNLSLDTYYKIAREYENLID